MIYNEAFSVKTVEDTSSQRRTKDRTEARMGIRAIVAIKTARATLVHIKVVSLFLNCYGGNRTHAERLIIFTSFSLSFPMFSA